MNQGNQTRSYKYDAMSRLLYERIPEQTATINDGTGTFWSCKYTYTNFNAPATRQDGRGVVTTYGYDPLNRLTTITSNTVSGVTTAPAVTYRYDTDPTYGTTANGKLVRVNVGSDYQERYTFDAYEHVASAIFTIGTRTYTTSYQHNQAGQPTQVGHMGYSYDAAGRLSAVGDSFYNATYNVAGQLTGDSLSSFGWNGTTLVDSVTAETFGYDANRMQLTSQTATTTNTNRPNQLCIPSCSPPPPGGTNLSLTYSYQASAGQMGAGTTAGNAGQLMSMTGTIGGVTESAYYQYDLLGRLEISSQTSNGTSAVNRKFAYDRWGNRTTVWNNPFGGNPIQSVTLEQSGGAPTNRIASVTNGGSTVNYSYDGAGSVTNDGAHSYNYDSENRLVSIDGGATGQYSYDHQNRRYKKTVGSTVIHYVWHGNKLLSEYNGSNGALQVNYWYAGERLFKKTGVTTQVFLGDQLSLRLALTDIGVVAGRQGHLPFGEDFAESGTQDKHHFTSYERDSESGLDYAVNRQYSPTTGRFTEVDAYRASCTENSPRGWNKYAYVYGDPVNHRDPSGLDPDLEFWLWLLRFPQWGGVSNILGPGGPGEIISIDYSGLIDIIAGLLGGALGGNPLGGSKITCGECCANAWDLCWDLFLMELGLVGTAGEAAFECYQECRSSSGRLAACMSICLVRKQIGRQKKIERAVKHFFECLGAQSRTCQSNIKDCWCPWT